MKAFQFTKVHWAVDREEPQQPGQLTTGWCSSKEAAIDMAKEFPKGRGPLILVKRTMVTILEPQPLEL